MVLIDRKKTTHSMCEKCWKKISPNRPPSKGLTPKEIPLEMCCYCGIPNKDGVYLYAELDDPKILCGGIHEILQEN